jgi:ubiquinone/menaquinone biosynthesis C-methylase UbiE
MSVANFDRVAGLYRTLELAAFGHALERARNVHLPRLAGCRDILLLGDGDGRTLERLLQINPTGRLVTVDASAVMLDVARRRIAAYSNSDRVTFIHADARAHGLESASFDAVVTQFFLDCFTHEEAASLVESISRAVRADGMWLFTDFAIPEHGIARRAVPIVTAALYAFFRWTTGLSARDLPPAEDDIARAGFARADAVSFAGGMLRSVLFARGWRLSGNGDVVDGDRG